MKYMGSKRAMLGNGLGHLLQEVLPQKRRFVDLFCGSGAVSAFVAQKHFVPVFASDLQQYAVTLTNATIARTAPEDTTARWSIWAREATAWLLNDSPTVEAVASLKVPQGQSHKSAVDWVTHTRQVCASLPPKYSLARAYGGYYFSAPQALAIESLRATVREADALALAALLAAASRCAAAPGHTAQPFSTTVGSLPHLVSAWKRDMLLETQQALHRLGATYSLQRGSAVVGDAFAMTEELQPSDLVFVDPPYSEVQYSRFYHVLESICRGSISGVSGKGRYPPLAERPQSKFCTVTTVGDEFDRLMLAIAAADAEALVTFPAGECSNGLAGDLVEHISRQYFRVKAREVASVFSTLGGNSRNRSARQGTTELILHLIPR